MSEAEDADQEEDEEEYIFVAAGENSCERCSALDGSVWQQLPNPPHAHCECEIEVRPKGVHRQRDCGDNRWTIEVMEGASVSYGPDDDPGFEWGFRVEVDCWDGVTHEFEIWVDFGKASDWPVTDSLEDDLMDYAWNEAYDEAESAAAQVCRPCPELIVS